MTRPKARALSVLAGVALLVPLFAAPVAADPQDPAGACTDGGVTVVVDLTDLDGEVVVGCAEGEPESGRDALESAGFETADSQPGMICAINSLPDPCPEEFDGNFWAYFTAEEGGEWEMSMEGADTAVPAPDSFEGWRYNDGSEAPDFEPVAGPQADADDATEDATADGTETSDAPSIAPSDDATATDDATADGQDGATDSESGIGTWGIVGIVAAVVVVLAVLGWVLSRRRRQQN